MSKVKYKNERMVDLVEIILKVLNHYYKVEPILRIAHLHFLADHCTRLTKHNPRQEGYNLMNKGNIHTCPGFFLHTY